MRYFYDTEFIEDGRTIDLISIGIVADDGREYYAVNADMPLDRIEHHQWLMDNVWPGLPLRGHKTGLVSTGNGGTKVCLTQPGTLDRTSTAVRPHWVIANEVREFLLATGKPELWAWYAAYDHVVLCQLWGSMVRLPTGLPMLTKDIKQECDRLGDPQLPEQPDGEHNALADARHNKTRFEYLAALRDIP